MIVFSSSVGNVSSPSVVAALQSGRVSSPQGGAQKLSDEEVLQLVECKRVASYKLESVLEDPERGVAVRRKLLGRQSGSSLEGLPFTGYDYSLVRSRSSTPCLRRSSRSSFVFRSKAP